MTGSPDHNALEAEGLSMLGLPDSPVVLRAIRHVAGQLQPLDSLSCDEPRLNYITRYRVASATVLEGLPIEHAQHQVRIYFGAVTTESSEASTLAFVVTELTGWGKPRPSSRRWESR